MYMLAQVSDLEVGELVHVIADAHIYDRHIPIVKEIIENEQYPAPEFVMNKEIKDFYAFTTDDFKLKGYECNKKKYDIPVAI